MVYINTNPIHFFTEAAKLSIQSSTKAFGKQSNTKYNLGSFHSASSTPKAFSITDGNMFAVEQDSTHLNIVLIPTRPVGEFLPNIFCFVYKGIKKSSLLSVDGLFIGDASLNDVTDRIHENHNAFAMSYESGETETDPIFANVILPYATKAGSEKIRDLLRETTSDPILVMAGEHIGDFDSSNFGLEIIMERWEMEPDLNLVRNGEHSAIVDYINPAQWLLSSSADIFKNKAKREEVLNYMDPAAFFGSFYNAEGWERLSYFDGGTEKTANEIELYNDIISKFHNHDVIYLDLRNALNYSLNLFGNTSDTLEINPSTSALKNVNYRRNYWPLLALNSSDFSSTTAHQWGEHSLFLDVIIPTEPDLPAPEVHIHCRELAREINRKKRKNNNFLSDFATDSGDTYYHIKVGKRNADPSIPESKPFIPVANYIRLTYGTNYPGHFADLVDFSEKIHLVRNYLDQLFIPFSTDVEPVGNQKLVVQKYSDDRMIAFQPSLNSSFICERGIAVGTDVVTFFAYPIKRAIKKYDQSDQELKVASMINYNNFNLLNKISSQYKSVEAVSGYLEFSTETAVPFHRLTQFRDETSNDPDVSELISLTITRLEYDAMKTLRDSSGFSDSFPVYFGVIPEAVDIQDKYRRSFTQFKLVLRGLVENEGEMKVKEVDTDKTITYAHN